MVLASALGGTALLAPPSAAIKADIARIRKDAPRTVPQDERPLLLEQLDAAERELDAGRPFVAMYTLEAPWETAAAFAFVAGSGVKTAEQFSRKWKEIGEPRRGAIGDRRSRPLVLEAFASAVEARAPATYRASLPFAQDSGLGSGLYYLGESQAFARFAAFCRSLEWPAPAPAPALRSIAPELTALDAQVVKAYESAGTDTRPIFIAINSTMKVARELDQQHEYAGALFEYLLARYRFSALHATGADLDAVRARLAAAPRPPAEADHSIAQWLLQLAESNAAAGDPPGIQRSASILDDVLPAYWTVVKS